MAIIETRGLKAFFGDQEILHGIDMDVPEGNVAALIGPSGCGKSTFLRCLNRLHEETVGARVEGKVTLEGLDLYSKNANPVLLRRRIGMVFQKPNPFPGMSIFDNVVAGLKLQGVSKKQILQEAAEEALTGAALWDEVKDKLNQPGTGLSGGQQQRLCIARATVLKPPVLLMDEPTSALDPISTNKIEELMYELKKKMTVVLVTHNMQQAARISDHTAFFLMGNLMEFAPTRELFTNPKNKKTEEYITGRFG